MSTVSKMSELPTLEGGHTSACKIAWFALHFSLEWATFKEKKKRDSVSLNQT